MARHPDFFTAIVTEGGVHEGGKYVNSTTSITYEPPLPSIIARQNTSRDTVLSILETARDEVHRHGSALRVIVGDSYGMGEEDVRKQLNWDLQRKGFRIEDSGFMTVYGNSF